MWMFGSRTTVKKVRNSLTWFSQHVRGPMMRQSALALVMATVVLAQASSSCTICSSSGRARKYFLRPPVRKPTLVWARRTVWTVMPAQEVTPLETIESWEEDSPLLARNRLFISLRLCRTAKLDLASAWNSQRSVNQSTTAPMSSTACMLARGTSQKIGRKSPRCGLSWGTYLPNF